MNQLKEALRPKANLNVMVVTDNRKNRPNVQQTETLQGRTGRITLGIPLAEAATNSSIGQALDSIQVTGLGRGQEQLPNQVGGSNGITTELGTIQLDSTKQTEVVSFHTPCNTCGVN